MIAAIIERDQEAGRELFADVGNATQPAWDRRGDGMREFVSLWDTHGAMLQQVVFPRLSTVVAGGDLAEALRHQHGRVVELAVDLTRRAPEHDADGHWLTDFESLKAMFDAQCLREMTDLIPMIRDRVPPPQVAEMTREARALRQARGR
ncbi:hemerythrin domain-containing protein [Azospirillum sp. sgz302134]